MLRVEENHYNVLPFYKVRGRLFDGASKMYKVEDVEGLDKWLKFNKLPGYHDEEDKDTKGTKNA
jgi:hypothetical protein